MTETSTTTITLKDCIKSFLTESYSSQFDEECIEYLSMADDIEDLSPVFKEFCENPTEIYTKLFTVVKECIGDAQQTSLEKFKNLSKIDREKDILVFLENFMLAFFENPLILHSQLILVRHKIHVVLGDNGAGKTSLLNKIHADHLNIANFPRELKIHYVRHHLDSDLSVNDFIRHSVLQTILTENEEIITQVVDQCLLIFSQISTDLSTSIVNHLSGGNKMKLSISISMGLEEYYDILLIDEPTNHLDIRSISWLADFFKKYIGDMCRPKAILLVTHDVNFLKRFDMDDLIYLYIDKRLKSLDYFNNCPIDELISNKYLQLGDASDEEEEEQGGLLESDFVRQITFPSPGKLAGLKSNLMRIRSVQYRYNENLPYIFNGLSLNVKNGNKIGIVGPNGAGKTTLVKLITGEITPLEGFVEKTNIDLVVSYIAQNTGAHLDKYLKNTIYEYMVDRFSSKTDGIDIEAVNLLQSDMKTTSTHESITQSSFMNKIFSRYEIADLRAKARKMGRTNIIVNILSRRKKRNSFEYEVEFEDGQVTYADRDDLVNKYGLVKLVHIFDDKIAANQTGYHKKREVNRENVLKHFKLFGFDEKEIVHSKISSFSGGNKSRLAIASAVWRLPHIIILDEPTNYLDASSLSQLSVAVQSFSGCILIVSHNEDFINSCKLKHKWIVNKGVAEVIDL